MKQFIFFIATFLLAGSAVAQVTLSGRVLAQDDQEPLPYSTVVFRHSVTETVIGALTDENGQFSITNLRPGEYSFTVSFVGYDQMNRAVSVEASNTPIDIGDIILAASSMQLNEVMITGRRQILASTLDRKTFSASDYMALSGGSAIEMMKAMPGLTINQDGKAELRGSDRVTVLIDGKQTALTGFGNQKGLENIPSSAIERIEIINNPSAKYDAAGMAGIINIVMKRNRLSGFSGNIGITTGAGSLWVRRENLPGIRPQYTFSPKLNPSLSLNWMKNNINLFLQVDHMYREDLYRNDFITRTYDDGSVVRQQLMRNKNTNFLTSKAGFDWFINERNTLTISGLYGIETLTDTGDQPFFNEDLSQRYRLWQFVEKEKELWATSSAAFRHKFEEAGHWLNASFNFTMHSMDEKYTHDNYLPASTGIDFFNLWVSSKVYDFNLDYIKPLNNGYLETGVKFRNRNIPVEASYIPGENSHMDADVGGKSAYNEWIPAVYANRVIEAAKWEAELGLRMEYVNTQYELNPEHIAYNSEGYKYPRQFQPFPNVRIAYKINTKNKISLFYNRRVDRPDEINVRVFPKYDDAEIIKIGNPSLLSQFSNSFELVHRVSWQNGYFFWSAYHRFVNGTITRVSTLAPGSDSNLIYDTFHNAGTSSNSGLEAVLANSVTSWLSLNANANVYYNQIEAFTVHNIYPVEHSFFVPKNTIYSGNVKLSVDVSLPKNVDVQAVAIYLAPDIIPQGKIGQRFSLDMGIKKYIQKGKGELFFNAVDLLNTMVVKKEIQGNGFSYTSDDYRETQILRAGYNFRF